MASSVNEQNPLDPDIHQHEEEEGHAMTKKKILMVLLVLTVITTIEFILALYVFPKFPALAGAKVFIYVALTLLKAFYIVAYFMHLKFERLNLIYCIVVPVIFIFGLIAGLISEGHHWLTLRF